MLVLLGGLLPGLPVNPAGAVPDPGPVAVVTTVGFTYLPGDAQLPDGSLTIHAGTRVYLTSADVLGNHTIYAYDLDASGFPVFASDDQVGPGQVQEVSGTASLPPRTYQFYCANHPGMNGSITVIP